MILVDSSVWIDHFRVGNGALADLIAEERVLLHPFVVGELVLGGLPAGVWAVEDLLAMPSATPADDDEVLAFIQRHALTGSGIGYADTHLLLSTRLTLGAALWTRDRRLLAVARTLGLAADIEPFTGFHED
jgi:hypothetical protein